MAERGIAPDELDAMLRHPDTTIPDPKGEPGCRYYTGRGMVAVVNEATHRVITVGVVGASSRDWRTFGAPRGGPMPTESPARQRMTARRRAVEPVTVTGANRAPIQLANVLDGVHPAIADGVRAELANLGLDFRSVRVESPTVVSIVAPDRRAC
jgi:hypothetical protein